MARGNKHKRRSEDDTDWSERLGLSEDTKRGVLVVFLFVGALLGLLALLDVAGAFGRWIELGLGAVFGWTRFAVPFVLLAFGFVYFYPDRYEMRRVQLLGFSVLVLAVQGLLHMTVEPASALDVAMDNGGGGFLGYALTWPLLRFTGEVASWVILVAALFIGVLLTFETSLEALVERSARLNGLFRLKWLSFRFGGRRGGGSDTEGVIGFEQRDIDEDGEWEEEDLPSEKRKAKSEEVEDDDEVEEEPAKKAQLKIFKKSKRDLRKIDIPLTLFEDAKGKPTSGDIAEQARIIEQTLGNFGIQVEMGEVQVGPTVTQYTLKPAEGIRLSKITSLSNDLSLALAAHPIRIEAPIPGKSLVGIEVPNQKVAVVRMREMLSTDAMKKRENNMMIALGKDVSGKPWIADLTRMPHLLVAGSTGSGKSVCLNSILLSLMYQNGPDEIKFILVDPKRVELPIYNNTPYLLTPVVTDVKKTINALQWLIGEMERRFEVLAASGCRDIASYNKSQDSHLPHIVLIIDELADLMVAAAAEVEGSIIRLAQMARAVGIHLVLATQRPSVDVITGLIKANMPARIAFAVASQMDSRTILDSSGAENLVGRGDMLFTSAELSKPKRLQGPYVSEEEIRRIVAHIIELGPEAEFDENVVERVQIGGRGYSGEDADPLLLNAKREILSGKKASASFLQRRLKVGYARAARLLDLLEEEGFIGPADGAKPRDILFEGTMDDVMAMGSRIADNAERADNAEGEEIGEEEIDNNAEEDEDATDDEETGDDVEEEPDDEEEVEENKDEADTNDDDEELTEEEYIDEQEGEYLDEKEK